MLNKSIKELMRTIINKNRKIDRSSNLNRREKILTVSPSPSLITGEKILSVKNDFEVFRGELLRDTGGNLNRLLK